jgi:hypothetical protein
MEEPNGANLLKLLVKLLAEQEGVKITFKIIGEQKNEEENT